MSNELTTRQIIEILEYVRYKRPPNYPLDGEIIADFDDIVIDKLKELEALYSVIDDFIKMFEREEDLPRNDGPKFRIPEEITQL